MGSTITGQKSKTDKNIYERIAQDMRKIRNGLWDRKSVDKALEQLRKMGVRVSQELTITDYRQEVGYCSIWVSPRLRLQFIVGRKSAYPHWDTIEIWQNTEVMESFWPIYEDGLKRVIGTDEVEQAAEIIAVLARMTPDRERVARSALGKARRNRKKNRLTIQCPRCGRELECDARDAKRGIKVTVGCEHCTGDENHVKEIWAQCSRCHQNYVPSFGPGDVVECAACFEERTIMSRFSHP